MSPRQVAEQNGAPVFVRHAGIPAPFLQHNVNTDMIAPAATGNPILPNGTPAERAFEGLRYFPDGRENPEFFSNQERYRTASILLVGRNFGTGSSRDTGVTWPMEMGIRVVIGHSFGPIFFTNALRYGLLAVTLEMEQIEELASWVESRPGVEMTVDLEREVIEAPGLAPVPFAMDSRIRTKLLEGLEDLDEIRPHIRRARELRTTDRTSRPWIYETSGNDGR